MRVQRYTGIHRTTFCCLHPCHRLHNDSHRQTYILARPHFPVSFPCVFLRSFSSTSYNQLFRVLPVFFRSVFIFRQLFAQHTAFYFFHKLFFLPLASVLPSCLLCICRFFLSCHLNISSKTFCVELHQLVRTPHKFYVGRTNLEICFPLSLLPSVPLHF